jgi:hypothetical protein
MEHPGLVSHSPLSAGVVNIKNSSSRSSQNIVSSGSKNVLVLLLLTLVAGTIVYGLSSMSIPHSTSSILPISDSKIFRSVYGAIDSKEFAVAFFRGKSADDTAITPISPWHDIHLKASENSELFRFICEIPRFTRRKFELNKEDRMNRILPDFNKQGELRVNQYGISNFHLIFKKYITFDFKYMFLCCDALAR